MQCHQAAAFSAVSKRFPLFKITQITLSIAIIFLLCYSCSDLPKLHEKMYSKLVWRVYTFVYKFVSLYTYNDNFTQDDQTWAWAGQCHSYGRRPKDLGSLTPVALTSHLMKSRERLWGLSWSEWTTRVNSCQSLIWGRAPLSEVVWVWGSSHSFSVSCSCARFVFNQISTQNTIDQLFSQHKN